MERAELARSRRRRKRNFWRFDGCFAGDRGLSGCGVGEVVGSEGIVVDSGWESSILIESETRLGYESENCLLS